MTEDTSPLLYVYVKGWEDHQPRADRPNLPWLRLHTKLLGNDAWLNLSCPDRCLLIGVWMLTQRYGNGQLLADERWLKSQAKAHKSSLQRLVQAGFLTLSTTKAEPNGGLEERRGEEKPLKVFPSPNVGGKEPATADAAGSPNGKPQKPPNDETWTEEAETQWRKDLAAWAEKEGIL